MSLEGFAKRSLSASLMFYSWWKILSVGLLSFSYRLSASLIFPFVNIILRYSLKLFHLFWVYLNILPFTTFSSTSFSLRVSD
jgi:hypothetical protein